MLTTTLHTATESAAAPVRRRDSLRAQTPAAMLMVAAVAALLMVNRAPTPQSATVSMVACDQCGEVVAVRPVTASKFGLPQAPEGSLALDIRMEDGTVRTIRSDDRNVHIGMRVPVTGGAVLSHGS